MHIDPLRESPDTWVELFPWLSIHRDIAQRLDLSVHDSALSAEYALKERALDEIATWVVDGGKYDSLQTLFPTLPLDFSLLTLPIGVRVRNVVIRENMATFRDVSFSTFERVSNWRSIGANSVVEFARALAGRVIEEARNEGDESDSAAARDEMAIEIANDMSTIASWSFFVGNSDQPMLASRQLAPEPARVTAARRRLTDRTAFDYLGESGSISAANHLDRWIQTVEPRRIEILRRRVFADSPEKLESIATSFGKLTRERVRQIESAAKNDVLKRLSERPFADALSVVREQIIGVTPLVQLIAAFPFLQDTVPSLNQPMWRILSRLEGGYEIANGWCTPGSIEAAVERTRTGVFDLAAGRPVIATDDVRTVLGDPALDATNLDAWMALCGFESFRGYLILQGSEMVGRALILLMLSGEPMELDDMHSQLEIERSVNSLANALAIDPRFDRVNRRSWGLREWGLDTYRTIRELVHRELERSGGAIGITELVERLTASFAVAPASVVLYASAPPFQTRDGLVRLNTEAPTRGRSPHRTARLFRHKDAWAYRITITDDHSRGSGMQFPSGVVSALGLTFGESRLMSSRRDEQVMTWTSPQPSLGSIRRFVHDDPIDIGTVVFLLFGDTGSFDIQPMKETNSLLGSILAMAGLDYSPDQPPMEKLALAIGAPTESGIEELVIALRQKGDDDIAELLESS